MKEYKHWLLPDKHCVFCNHCTDIFWDYTNGPYIVLCDKYHVADYRNCKSFKEEKQ